MARYESLPLLFVAFTLGACHKAAVSPPPDVAQFVNTTFGTNGLGNTFPGADFPFGMVQWSPDTAAWRPEGGGYEYLMPTFRGFALTHISGPGCAIYGDVPILPMTGGLPPGDPGQHMEPIDHTHELGTAGYYTVQTGSPAITTEITATQRSGMARFTYPATTQANLLIKLLDSQSGDSGATVSAVNQNEVIGSVTSGHFCGASDVYTVFFDLIFDQPFTASQVIHATSGLPDVMFLTFDTTAHPVVQAKVGISFVSVENARGNWHADNPGWDFDSVHAAAHDAWNDLLGEVQIGGASADNQRLFYSALYMSLLHPNVFSDSNGQYIGFDNVVHTVSPGQTAQYANYSGWDIYHGQVPLSALLAPKQMSDSAQSMVNDATQNDGLLPKWALANAETYIMTGDPSDGIIAGYYAFGARNFDTATALKLMVQEATVPNTIRPGLTDYETLGYLPDDGTYGCCHFYGSVATLLEYQEADFALSQFASALGDASDAATVLARTGNWQNVFNPANNLLNPKLKDGSFVGGMGLTSTQGMIEGSASQYRWLLPADPAGLLVAMGGASVVNPLLTAYFSNLDDHAGVGALLSNEFDLGEQYWFNYTGQPWNTQDVCNRIRTTLYHPAPGFLANNNDLGAESAQLVWTMLGFYPTYPGSGILNINGPEFTTESIRLPSGKTLTVNAPGASPDAPYIQSLKVNGQPATHLWLDPSVWTDGATLDFVMGASPNTSWGTAASDAPPSYGVTGAAPALGYTSVNPLTLTNGAEGSATVGAQSRITSSQTITWQVAASEPGLTVAPSSGQFSLPPDGGGSATFAVTAPATPGSYELTFHLASSQGGTLPDVVLPVQVSAVDQ
jgi:predicted alpha-1,2-mannosidase